MRAELRVEMCGISRGSACLAVSPCANVHVIVLGAVLCACELSLGISECIRANYRLGRVCYVKLCYHITHSFTRPLYTCSSLTRCVLLGSKSACARTNATQQQRTMRDSFEPSVRRGERVPSSSAHVGHHGDQRGSSKSRRGPCESIPKWSALQAAWAGWSTRFNSDRG